MPITLNCQALKTLPNIIKKPNYKRESLTPGIIHVGVGNFHRAHQAMYLHNLFNAGLAHDWAIIGAGVTSYDEVMRAKLVPQDWLTTIVELDNKGLSAHICGSMIGFINNNPETLITALCKENIRIVSLTITEGGYFMDDTTGSFNFLHKDIQADITNIHSPSTIFGIIIAALIYRRAKNLPAFTVMSCDNIPHNGHITECIIKHMSAAIDPELKQWIQENVTFPNSMVDCITPATSVQEKNRLMELFNIDDQAPVFCEPFRQWVLEDNFTNGRPPLEQVGVEFVDDVAPFELMKLRILNGGHASIAYPAALLGIHFVHDVLAYPMISHYLKKLVSEEIIPSIPPVPGVDLHEYFALIESRFANPEVRDTVPRLCQDASNRLPKFILPIITENLKSGNDCKGLVLVVALWCRLCAEGEKKNKVEAGKDTHIPLIDAQAQRLIKHSLLAKQDPLVFLRMTDIFGELSDNTIFSKHFTTWLHMLWQSGVKSTLTEYLK